MNLKKPEKEKKKFSYHRKGKNFFYKMVLSHTCNTDFFCISTISLGNGERKKQTDGEAITFPYNLYTDF